MVKKSLPKANKKIVIIVATVVLVLTAAAGILLWYNARQNVAFRDSPRSEKACRTTPAKVSSMGFYDIPCTVTVITMQYGQTVDEAGERARVEAAIAQFDASISPTSLPETGIYYLDVAPGTEDAIIAHLMNQPGIQDARRQGGCDNCVGPN